MLNGSREPNHTPFRNVCCPYMAELNGPRAPRQSVSVSVSVPWNLSFNNVADNGLLIIAPTALEAIHAKA